MLDIGCGAGALTLKVADQSGAGKGALGVDVSVPLIELAKRRASEAQVPARFECADASTFDMEEATDVVVSRFGVMFFDDPASAFARIRAGSRRGGRLAFICWQALAKNDWALAPLQAALPFLNEPPAQLPPDAPGPFAFGDKDHVARVLLQAGWKDVRIDPVDTRIVLPGEDTVSTAEFMMQLGPLSRILAEQALDAGPVLDALVARISGECNANGRVTMPAACWLVTARNPT